MANKVAALQVLQADTIGNLSDGYTGRLINKALESAIADTNDRGHDGQVRKVTIELTIKKAAGARGKEEATGDRYQIDTNVKLKVPAHVPHPTICRIDLQAGGFTFRPDNSDNPDQRTFAEMIDDKGEVIDPAAAE